MAQHGKKYRKALDGLDLTQKFQVDEALKMAVRDFQLQGLASEHDAVIMGELANILCGGDVSLVQEITEERILELERQAFARLCGYEKTQARMDAILKTGKPLRN